MSKFYGLVGFAEIVESTPGVFKDTIVEREMFGDLLQESWGSTSTQEINDAVTVRNRISLLSTQMPIGHAGIRWVQVFGSKWKVTGIEYKHPRAIITLGGLYNG